MKIVYSLFLLLLMVGCGQEEPPQATGKQKTLIDDQLKMIDRAKAVEDTVQQGAERKRKAIEDAGG